jgi:hypothetical protein
MFGLTRRQAVFGPLFAACAAALGGRGRETAAAEGAVPAREFLVEEYETEVEVGGVWTYSYGDDDDRQLLGVEHVEGDLVRVRRFKLVPSA